MTEPKRLHIFRPGRHTALSGVAIEFASADLQATAAAYDPGKHEAPFVVGHPSLDSPAYGWVRSLSYGEHGLEAEPAQVDPAFAEMVSNGRFKKISAAFFPPGHPGNPVPEVYYLRHVGFLGARAPAVKGLRSPEFAGDEEGIVTIEFADAPAWPVASMFRRLRDWMISQFDLQTADSVLPDYAIGDLEDAARKPATPADIAPSPAYAEPTLETDMDPKELASQEAQLKAERERIAAEDADLKSRQTAFAEQERTARNATIAASIDELVGKGIILPAERVGAIAFAQTLDASQSLEFGEGDDKQTQDQVAWFLEFAGKQAPRVDFSEHSAPATEDSNVVAFAAPQGYVVDPKAAELDRKARAWQANHPDSDYLAAVRAVS